MANTLEPADWEALETTLGDGRAYGLPLHREGSFVFGSWNLRKFGAQERSNRPPRTQGSFNLIARFCAGCDLVALQEVQDDLWSVRQLVEVLRAATPGRDFRFITSDVTGASPNYRGMKERFVFVYDADRVSVGQLASDLVFEQTAVLSNVNTALKELDAKALEEAGEEGWMAYIREWLSQGFVKGKLDHFLAFIRSPHMISFELSGDDGEAPYVIACVNAHLLSGRKIEREREFFALLDWLVRRGHGLSGAIDAPIIMLLADLNLDFENSADKQKSRIAEYITDINKEKFADSDSGINFPFLDVHPSQSGVFLTNARESQTFDHIAFLSSDRRLPLGRHNGLASTLGPDGFDYGMFDFVQLLRDAGVAVLPDGELDNDAFEYELSDHKPIWLRLERPVAGQRLFERT